MRNGQKKYMMLTKEKKMTEKTVPYFKHEAEMTRLERRNTRLFAAFVIASVLLAASNAVWIICR